ncbi:hypothetical protein [Fulvitalea axinellae]|uniref:hypothetical protein n=1 Tax=Fulvitalea axinellae TaxID=1182444 RepID=UPI0030CA4FDC
MAFKRRYPETINSLLITSSGVTFSDEKVTKKSFKYGYKFFFHPKALRLWKKNKGLKLVLGNAGWNDNQYLGLPFGCETGHALSVRGSVLGGHAQWQVGTCQFVWSQGGSLPMAGDGKGMAEGCCLFMDSILRYD